jgi:dephospho-CoA kinase
LSERKANNDIDLRFRSFTKEEARARDFAEIENIEKAGPIAMADYTIINIGSVEQMKIELNKILQAIENDNN